MNNYIRQAVLFVVLSGLLGTVTFMTFGKEKTLSTGQLMLLELAPRDPRSLMQGDYMVLRYKLVQTLGGDSLPKDGTLVVLLDDNSVGAFTRVHAPGMPLAANEHLLRYRRRGSGIRLGAESFFFQEGDAKYYSGAKYGELRVSETGDAILIGLRNQERVHLGPPPAVSAL